MTKEIVVDPIAETKFTPIIDRPIVVPTPIPFPNPIPVPGPIGLVAW
jgi:hypothetical protein